MAAVRVERGLSVNSQFMKAARKRGAAVTEKRLRGLAQVAEQAFDEIVGEDFVNDRSADRRRPGRHLLGSSVCTVEGGGDFPMKLVLKSLAPSVKVNSLNYGAKPHEIRGSPFLYFPAASQSAKFPGRQAAYTRNRAGARAGGRRIRTPQVDHPGNEPHNFLERALERAVEREYGAARARRRS